MCFFQPHLKTLETLNLGKNNLENRGIHTLKESLMINRSLLQLGLAATGITCEGRVRNIAFLNFYLFGTSSLYRFPFSWSLFLFHLITKPAFSTHGARCCDFGWDPCRKSTDPAFGRTAEPGAGWGPHGSLIGLKDQPFTHQTGSGPTRERGKGEMSNNSYYLSV